MPAAANVIKAVDLLHRRHPIDHTLYFMKEVLVVYKHQLYLGIVEGELQVGYVNGGIKRHEYGPYLLYSQVQEHPFWPVLGNHRNLIALFYRHVLGADAQGNQTGTEAFYDAGDLFHGVGPPLASFPGGQKWCIRAFDHEFIHTIKQPMWLSHTQVIFSGTN